MTIARLAVSLAFHRATVPCPAICAGANGLAGPAAGSICAARSMASESKRYSRGVQAEGEFGRDRAQDRGEC